MSIHRGCLLTVFLFSVGAAAQITESKAMPSIVTVQVDASSNIGTVPPRIFGTFIEPIDHSIDNGVVAEILVNGSLEAGLWNHAMLEQLYRDEPDLIESSNNTGIPIPWQPLNPAAGNRYELHVGDAANSWQSLEIMGVPGQLTGIAQRVYLPIPRTFLYNVSFYAKHLSGPAGISVSLRTIDGETIVAQAAVKADAPRWARYTAQLRVPVGQVQRLEPVRFSLSVESLERVDVDQISLMPSDAIDTLDPQVVRMAADMNMTELRLGGNFSSYYHWKDGIGPLDKRVTSENIAWGIPEYNNFGTDEFLQFCKLVKAEPQFNVNMGSGTPEEAVDWMKYVRVRYQGPLIVEMGNELYGKWQVGYPTLQELADRTLRFSQALRPIVPDATFLATGATPENFDRWNAEQLKNPASTFDLLTTHFIVGTNHVRLLATTPEFMAAAAYAVPFAVGEQFDRMQTQLDQKSGFQNTHFAVTEWLFNSKGAGERNFTNESPSSRNEGGAVMIAATFNTFFRHSKEIKLVDMTGLMEFAGIWKRREQVFGTPAYYVFRMYSSAKDQFVLPITSNTGTYSVENGTQGFPEVKDVPYIDSAATRAADGESLTVYLVNRSLIRAVPTKIDVKGFLATGFAKVQQISALSRYVMNDEVEPKRVVPSEFSLQVAGQATMTVTLPQESVTVIQLRSR